MTERLGSLSLNLLDNLDLEISHRPKLLSFPGRRFRALPSKCDEDRSIPGMDQECHVPPPKNTKVSVTFGCDNRNRACEADGRLLGPGLNRAPAAPIHVDQWQMVPGKASWGPKFRMARRT